MKRKQLKSFLQQLETFSKPTLELEQYSTSPSLGAEILERINFDCDFEEVNLLGDLGCGCGILMLGAAQMGANCVVGWDVDTQAIDACHRNILEKNLDSNCNLIQADVIADYKPYKRFYEQFDVIITNPPFGTKNNTGKFFIKSKLFAGIDIKFLEEGFRLLKPNGVLFSLHKTATRKFLERKITREWKNICSYGECIAELIWNLEKTYRHQKLQNFDIQVDLFKFIKCV